MLTLGLWIPSVAWLQHNVPIILATKMSLTKTSIKGRTYKVDTKEHTKVDKYKVSVTNERVELSLYCFFLSFLESKV